MHTSRVSIEGIPQVTLLLSRFVVGIDEVVR
jgi:hypothetical protein